MRRSLLLIVLVALACSQEKPAPPAASSASPALSQPAVTKVTVEPSAGTYEEGIVWFRSTPGFHFELDEAGVHASGEMKRTTVGAERVELQAEGTSWRVSSGPKGITWEKLDGRKWVTAGAPAYGNRLFQRVTVAFDPQKRERSAQLAGSDATTNHYRFTDANNGETHEVWVSRADNHITRMKSGPNSDLVITAAR